MVGGEDGVSVGHRCAYGDEGERGEVLTAGGAQEGGVDAGTGATDAVGDINETRELLQGCEEREGDVLRCEGEKGRLMMDGEG